MKPMTVTEYPQWQRVLVLENEEHMQMTLSNLLRSRDLATEICGSLDQAKKKLKQLAFGVALVDISLDESDEDESGLDLAHDIFCNYMADPMSCIILTGRGTARRARNALKVDQATDFLEKQDPDIKDKLRNLVVQKMEEFKKAEPRLIGPFLNGPSLIGPSVDSKDAVLHNVALGLGNLPCDIDTAKGRIEHIAGTLLSSIHARPVAITGLLPVRNGVVSLELWSRSLGQRLWIAIGKHPRGLPDDKQFSELVCKPCKATCDPVNAYEIVGCVYQAVDRNGFDRAGD
jgi:ActR/RegA family two-component response regulator